MQVLTRWYSLFSILIVVLVSVISINLSYSWAQSVPMVSTRDHFNTSTGETLAAESYDQLESRFFNNICVNDEVSIYVHGIWTNPGGHIPTSAENAEEVFDRLKMSLDSVGYHYPLIGFTWDSDTSIDPEGTGWNVAKYIAKENGPKLADFIIDLKNHCMDQNLPDIQVRLLGHSLGSRVILSALGSLENDVEWNANGFKILSVNLLGGAVDNYEVLKGNVNETLDEENIKHYYGQPIENQVLYFYNMYNSEDDVLEPKYWTNEWYEPIYYPFYEYPELAIGQHPLNENTFGMPENYKNRDVERDLIVDIDADNDAAVLGTDGCDLPNVFTSDPSDCTINGEGDNHLGYIGFRNPDNSLLNEGAIDKVVETWRMP